MAQLKSICLLATALICTAITGGCNDAEQTITPNCKIDASLIHNWSEFGSLPERDAPYTQVYTGCGKTLVYVAAKHSNDPKGATHTAVKSAFENYDIDFAIAEGFPSDMGISPKVLIDDSNGTKGTPRDAEPYLVVRKAVAKSIGFQGGEPKDKDIKEVIAKRGVNPVDLLGYYIVRQIPQWVRREEITDITDSRIEKLIFNMVGAFSTDTDMRIETFKEVDGIKAFRQWYEKTNGVTLTEGLREQDAWPSSAIPDPRKTNELSDKVADIRDAHIVGVINDALMAHDTVLVVYGASHHDIQAPAFEAAFPAASK